MKKLLKYRYLWIAVILLAAVGACCLFPTSREQSRVASPAPIVVDASHNPATVTVHGVHVTLNRVFDACVGNILCAEIETKTKPHGPYITPDCFYSVIGGKTTKSTNVGTGTSDGESTWLQLNPLIPVKKTTKRFDLVCRLQFNTYSGKRKFEFRNVSPSRLPLTKKVGPVSVTLERAYYGKSPKGYVHYSDAKHDKFFVLIYSVSGPPDNFRMKFKLQKDSWGCEDTSLKPFWHDNYTNIQVTDEAGKSIVCSGYSFFEAKGGASDAFQQETDRRTMMESLMSRINRQAASDMITNRAMQKAQTYPKKFRTISYYRASSAPKRFTFKTEINTAPVGRKLCIVIFKNIRVPKE